MNKEIPHARLTQVRFLARAALGRSRGKAVVPQKKDRERERRARLTTEARLV